MSHFKFVVLLTHPKLATLAFPLSTCSYSLYTSPGLKGQFILAPGFDVRLRRELSRTLSRTATPGGKRIKDKPVRAKMLIRAILKFRTELSKRNPRSEF